MDPGKLKNYLKSLAGAGIAQTQLNDMVDVAAESGYASVWGAYPWSFRRATTTLNTSASLAYTALPSDFESVVSIRYQGGASGNWLIDIMEEVGFDESYPNPSIDTGIPKRAKIVYETASAADKFRAVWYPYPSATYSMALVYNRKADLANLPNLPSWMVNAVVQHAASLMMPTIEARSQHAALAQYALNAAINADRPVTGVGPRWGADVGFDDWSDTKSGSWLE